MTSYRRWVLGGITVAFFVFLLGYFLILGPARNNAAALHEQVEELNARNLTATHEIAQFSRQADRVPAKLAKVDAARAKLPPDLEQAVLVRSIESEAGKAGVFLESVDPGKPKLLAGSAARATAGVPVVSMPLAVVAAGSYTDIKDFVSRLERMERAYLIASMHVGSAGDSTGNISEARKLSLKLIGQVYSVPEEAFAVDAPASAPDDPEAPGGNPGSPTNGAETSGQTGQAAAKPDKAAGRDKRASSKQ